MKLTVGYSVRTSGFALPTILLVSTVMLIILVSSIAAAAASRVSLDSQYYNQLAGQAAESGIARANECLKGNGYMPQWSTSATGRNLRPNSDCTGATMTGGYVREYVVGQGGGASKVRTRYSVDAPNGTKLGSILRVVGTTELVRGSSPYNVWRSYEQSLFLRIEPTKTVACPTGFIAVPGDARFNTTDFCVGKYEAKNVGGKAVSQADGEPWLNISQTDAMAAASAACTGCSLINEAQWLTIAHNVTGVSSNWSGGSVGNGYIYRGHTDNVPAAALAASTDDTNGYVNTGQTSGDQRRTLRLNDGEVIWDFSGNLREFTTGQAMGGQPGSSGFAWRDWNAISGGTLSPSPFPVYATPAASSWTAAANGIGRAHTDSSDTTLRAMTRGGAYINGTDAGIFALVTNSAPDGTSAQTGFRIVYNPLATTTCPDGQVLVPGNSTFGTKNFCVGKYEAKNVGGIATSRAAGTPWNNITQADATTAASAACSTCRLISDAEWLTIMHNVLSVPSNWSGGTVGSGYIYSGHNDGNPASLLTASTDDSNGYSDTGNSSGNQRRTLKLNNGNVIWDLAGNIFEWTSGTITSGKPGTGTLVWNEWNVVTDTGTLSPSPIPSYGTPAASGWTSTNGIGQIYSNSASATEVGVLRGGSRTSGAQAGVATANYANGTVGYSSATVGFRVTSEPISAISCSVGGMIPVPGDSRFGTSDFCVGKYEAKDNGSGAAVTQAAGTPFVGQGQTGSITLANAVCAKCRLIGEAEWLTIAHNLVNVPSNWTSGIVGSGTMYVGHSDSSPANTLAASTDNDGYSGTGNTVGAQRRTLTLSNGQVIWDFSGNAYEWTLGQMSTGKPGASTLAWRDWNTLTDPGTFVPNPWPSFATPAANSWANAQGMGRLYSDSGNTSTVAFFRGGAYNSVANSGVFSLGLAWAPSSTSTLVGFRVVEIK